MHEEQALRTYLEQYLGQEDAVTPPGNAVPVDVIGAFVKFHKGNEVWGTYVGKSFVKTDLIGEFRSDDSIRFDSILALTPIDGKRG